MEDYPKRLTIDIGQYFWRQNIPKPKCDSCKENEPTHKVYTDNVGIRLCGYCLERLKDKLNKNTDG